MFCTQSVGNLQFGKGDKTCIKIRINEAMRQMLS